jgi:hypothetical protein
VVSLDDLMGHAPQGATYVVGAHELALRSERQAA